MESRQSPRTVDVIAVSGEVDICIPASILLAGDIGIGNTAAMTAAAVRKSDNRVVGNRAPVQNSFQLRFNMKRLCTVCWRRFVIVGIK